MQTWDISPRGEKRFTDGHPWVFSNEITSPIKKIEPGELIRLVNSKGKSLAIGYGNPHSLIAFRCLNRDDSQVTPDWLAGQIIQAALFRDRLQMTKYSHRLVFSEADNLPGVIIDCFKTPQAKQVFVIELLTAGMEKLFADAKTVFEKFLARCAEQGLNYYPWAQTTLVVKRDNSFRRMENLELLDTEIIGELGAAELADVSISVAQALDKRDYLVFHTDLVDGQKTGFFLDQRSNVELLLNHLPRLPDSKVRVLDLFCYVGQWGAQIARHLRGRDIPCQVTAVDASQKALDFALKNLTLAGGDHTAQKMDIVEKANEIPPGIYDIVICDPPALIKSKKDYHAGKAAYTKTNTAAMRALKPGGVIISCSCSQHLNDTDLMEVLTEAALKAGRRIAWIAKGQQAPDHPMLLEFPQGTYLNSWLGVVRD